MLAAWTSDVSTTSFVPLKGWNWNWACKHELGKPAGFAREGKVTAVSRSGIEAADVRAQLQRIVTASDFEASDRNRRFLSFVVEKSLSGDASLIKAYTIATSVFGRGQDFDPQMDSIVRIEAGRLRRALENYYLRSGADDPIEISIPKGSYAPKFMPRVAVDRKGGQVRVDPPVSRETASRSGLTIFVAPFEEEEGAAARPNFTHGLIRQIIVGLTRFTDLFVFGPNTTFGTGPDVDRVRPRPELEADFILTGGTSLSSNQFSIEVMLINAIDGQCLWGETFNRRLEPGEILRLRDEVANSVVRTLAQPYGILSSKALDIDGDHPETMSSYDCVVRFHTYWRTYDREMFESVRVGLEQAIAADPGYAEAFACLSQIYTNAARFGEDVSHATKDPLKRARDLALRAIELTPGSSRGHHALGLALWFSGNLSGSLEALETGLALNPNDSEIMADLGLRRTMRMDWDRGVPLLEESYARNPAQPSPHRVGLVLYHLVHDRDEAAFDEARRIDAPQLVYGHLLTAVAAARLGRWQEANASMQSILEIDSDYFNRMIADLQSRNLHSDLIEIIVAGLPVLECQEHQKTGNWNN